MILQTVLEWAETTARFGPLLAEAAAKGMVWLLLAWGVSLVMWKA